MASSRSAVATKADIDSLRTEIKKDLARFATKDDFRGLAVMVERLESTVRRLAEGVVATREQLERKIDEGDSRLERRLKLVEDVVRESSRKQSDDMTRVEREISELRRDYLRGERIGALEARVTVLEQRVERA